MNMRPDQIGVVTGAPQGNGLWMRTIELSMERREPTWFCELLSAGTAPDFYSERLVTFLPGTKGFVPDHLLRPLPPDTFKDEHSTDTKVPDHATA